MADIQPLEWRSFLEHLFGNLASAGGQYLWQRTQPRPAFDTKGLQDTINRMYDLQEQDLVNQIDSRLIKRGVSGAPGATTSAWRPVADIKARRAADLSNAALMGQQYDYTNQMQDYASKSMIFNALFPSLFSYKDYSAEEPVERAGLLASGVDWLMDLFQKPPRRGRSGLTVPVHME